MSLVFSLKLTERSSILSINRCLRGKIVRVVAGRGGNASGRGGTLYEDEGLRRYPQRRRSELLSISGSQGNLFFFDTHDTDETNIVEDETAIRTKIIFHVSLETSLY